MSTEPLTAFEIQHPDPRSREAARGWIKFATDCGMSPSMAALVVDPTQQLDVYSSAQRIGKSRIGLMLMTQGLPVITGLEGVTCDGN